MANNDDGDCCDYGRPLGFDYAEYNPDPNLAINTVTYTFNPWSGSVSQREVDVNFNPVLVVNPLGGNPDWSCGTYDQPSCTTNPGNDGPYSSKTDAKTPRDTTLKTFTCRLIPPKKVCGQMPASGPRVVPNHTDLSGWSETYDPFASDTLLLRHIPDIGYLDGITNLNHVLGGARSSLTETSGLGGNGMCFPSGVPESQLKQNAVWSDFDAYMLYRRRTFMR